MKENYKKGFEILMEYFNSIADEEKEEVDQRLKEVGF
jgi:predicted CopG family antitoxin